MLQSVGRVFSVAMGQAQGYFLSHVTPVLLDDCPGASRENNRRGSFEMKLAAILAALGINDVDLQRAAICGADDGSSGSYGQGVFFLESCFVFGALWRVFRRARMNEARARD